MEKILEVGKRCSIVRGVARWGGSSQKRGGAWTQPMHRRPPSSSLATMRRHAIPYPATSGRPPLFKRDPRFSLPHFLASLLSLL
jgi:hypothetical protein